MQNKSRDPYSRFDDVPSEAEKKAKVKKIAIIVAVVLVAIVAVVLGLVFGLKKKPPADVIKMERKNNNYCFAMKESDDTFTIPMDIFEGNDPDAFDVDIKVIKNNIKLEKNVVTVINKLPEESEGSYGLGEIIFKKNDDVYVRVYIQILRKDVIEVDSYSSLVAIPEGANGTYLQTKDINLEGKELLIKAFKGTYYGNHNKLIGLDVSANGGLFLNPTGATLMGINLVDFKYDKKDASTGNKSIGLLANGMNAVDLVGVKVKGEIIYSSSVIDSSRVINVGGIAGYSENAVLNDIEIKGCESDVNIKVSASGQALHIGGLIGNARNAFIEESKSFGKVEYSYSNEGTNSVYLGGIVGFLKGRVDTYVHAQPLDMGWFFESSSNVLVNVKNDSIKFCIGGIVGKMVDYQLHDVIFNGKIDIDCVNSEVNAGNIVGEVENKVFAPDTEKGILITQITIKNSIKVSSDGHLRLGSIIGASKSQTVAERYGIACRNFSNTPLADITRKSEAGKSKETWNKQQIGVVG